MPDVSETAGAAPITLTAEQATILLKGDVLKRTKKENLGRRSNWRGGNPSEKHHSDNRAE